MYMNANQVLEWLEKFGEDEAVEEFGAAAVMDALSDDIDRRLASLHEGLNKLSEDVAALGAALDDLGREIDEAFGGGGEK